MKIALCVAFLLSNAIAAEIKINPLSDEFINYINSQQNSWKAGRNFDENTPLSEIRCKLGLLKKDPNEIKAKNDLNINDVGNDIPESFDSREQWPQCADVIGTIADQSNCGSCWAVAAASAMSDRRCIASNGELKVPVSAEDLLSCCKSCGFGCNGGYILRAWNYWVLEGIVTGGLYNSSTGCKPYSMQSCDHHVEGSKISCDQIPAYDTPSCTSECTTEDLVYENDLTTGRNVNVDFFTAQNIQRDILEFGPLEAGFDVYDDFLLYKSGVYHHVAGAYQGGHAVRIIGWGTENDTPYWLIANSWNEEWGDKGLFKIRRGSNECGIESDLGAAEAIV